MTPHWFVKTGWPVAWMSTASSPKASRTLNGPAATSNATSLMNTVDLAATPGSAMPVIHPIISHVLVEGDTLAPKKVNKILNPANFKANKATHT